MEEYTLQPWDFLNKKWKRTGLTQRQKNQVGRLRSSLTRRFKKSYYNLNASCIEDNLRYMINYQSHIFLHWWKPEYKDILTKNPELYGPLFYFCTYYKKFWFDPKIYTWDKSHTEVIRYFDFNEIADKYLSYLNLKDPAVLSNLMTHHNSQFKTIWGWLQDDEKDILRYKLPHCLAAHCYKYFTYWYKDDMDVTNCLNTFISNCHTNYNLWWKPKYKDEALRSCQYAICNSTMIEHFNDWFDKEKFHHEQYADLLTFNHPDKFDQWFDKSRYPYTKRAYYAYQICQNLPTDIQKKLDSYDVRFARDLLVIFCSDKFKEWFSKVRFRPSSRLFNLLKLRCEDVDGALDWMRMEVKYELKK